MHILRQKFRKLASRTLLLVTAFILTSSTFVFALPKRAVADPLPPAWSGTISAGYAQLFEGNGYITSVSGSGAYYGLAQTENGIDYTANVNATFDATYTGPCDVTHAVQKLTSAEWAFNGPSTSTVDSAGQSVSWASGGSAFRLWDTEAGTFFLPYGVVFAAWQNWHCGEPHAAYQAYDALSYQHGWTAVMPDTPLVDTDPDPNRLVGTTTYDMSTVPGGPFWNYLGYGYSVTYDLTRSEAPDTDGDGLSDIDEVNVHGTNPNVADTDGDGLNDGAEVNTHNTNPNNSDTDSDGLLDGTEVTTTGTSPTNPDTDGDNQNDGSDPCPLDAQNACAPPPPPTDTDGDGVTDDEETDDGTDPNDPDTDNDNTGDGEDNCALIKNKAQGDSDKDGVGNACDDILGGDLGMVCGEAAFDRYHITKQQTAVDEGEESCTFLVSNRLANEVLDYALAGEITLTQAFADELEGYVQDELSEYQVRAKWKSAGKRWASKVFPDVSKAFKRVNFAYNVAEIATYAAVPISAAIVVDHIRDNEGCIQITAGIDGDKVDVDWNIVHSPDHWTGPAINTKAHVWEKIPRPLQQDKLKGHALGMNCLGDGSVKKTNADITQEFNGPVVRELFSGGN